VNRILKPISYVLAAVYFLVDAVFIAVAKPVSDWLAKHLVLRKLRIWIRSLRPYPSLALFSVPVIILEPVKPGGDGPNHEQRSDVDCRRASQACAN